MGQPSNFKGRGYRDDPSISDAVSLNSQHAAPEDDDHPDIPDFLGEEPPAYTDSEPLLFTTAGDGSPTFAPFANHKGVDIIMNPHFDTDPDYAEECVRKWARSPPSQIIHILGTHTRTVKDEHRSKQETVTDFDIKVNMGSGLLNGPASAGSSWMDLRTVANSETTYRGGCFRKRAPGWKARRDEEVLESRPTLTEWCHRFCASHIKLKTFRFTRTISGLDEDFLRQRISSIVYSTNYRGHTQITFPVDQRAVEVYSSTWQNRWRWTTWICFAFYLSFLWLFSWPYLFFSTKRFHVVVADWPFSKPDEAGRKRYATVSEEVWLEKFKVAIEEAVCWKRQGYVTEEDVERLKRPREEIRTGNRHVDAVAGFFTAGASAYNQVNRHLGWGGDC